MEIKRNPFSVYDFLGYLVPGFILHNGYYLFFNKYFLEIRNFPKGLAEGTQSIYYIQLTVFFYIIGHIVSYLSSVTIERYLFKNFGSPSDNFIGYKPKKRFLYPLDIITIIFLLPISIIDYAKKYIFKIKNPHSNQLDINIQKCAKDKMRDFFVHEVGLNDAKIINKINSSDHPDINYFSSAYYYIIENYPSHFQKTNNYVALYGFLRSITFVFVVFYWSFVLNEFVFNMHNTIEWSVFADSIKFAIFSYITYLAYVKLHRRFSEHVVMGICINYKKPSNKATNTEN